ncbi:MAG: hypothetical protein ACTHJ6_07470 [Oryzihumus sp.]
MSFVFNLVLVLHLLGMAAIVGGWFAVVRSPRIAEPIVWGARAQILTGLILVGLAEAGWSDHKPDNAWVAVKLVVALAVVALSEITRAKNRRGESFNPNLVHAVGGLAVVNLLVAALWT